MVGGSPCQLAWVKRLSLLGVCVLSMPATAMQVVVPEEAAPVSQPLKFKSPQQAERVAIADILPRLDAADMAARDNATGQLLAQVYTLSEIEAELARPALSPEQVARLSIAGYAAFCREPRGALGVQFGEGGNGVSINGFVNEGFPAAKILRVGDVILDIGGYPIRGGDGWSAVPSVRPHIISYNAGEVAPITVLRDKQRVTVDVRLGNFANLGNNQFLDQSEYAASWAIRLARTRPAMIKQVITPAQPEGGWSPDGFAASDLERKHQHDGQAGVVPSLVAGGVAGSRPDRSDRAQQLGDLGGGVRQLVIRPDGVIVNNGVGQRAVRIGQDPAFMARIELQQQQMLLEMLTDQQREWKAALKDPALDPADRRRVERMLDAVAEQIAMIRKRMGDGRNLP